MRPAGPLPDPARRSFARLHAPQRELAAPAPADRPAGHAKGSRYKPSPSDELFRSDRQVRHESVENASSGANEPPDESTLLPAVENTPNAVGTVLAHYPALRIAVGGHTDAIGSDAYN